MRRVGFLFVFVVLFSITSPIWAADIVAGPDPTAADIGAAQPIQAGSDWTYTPDVAPSAGFGTTSFDVPGGSNDFTIEERLCIAPQAHIALLSHCDTPKLAHVPHDFSKPRDQQPKPPERKKAWTVDKIDLKSGKVLETFGVPMDMRVISVSPDAKTAVFQPADGIDAKQEIDVVDLTTTPPKVVMATLPYGNEDKTGRIVETATLIDAEHLLTSSNGTNPKIVLWELPKMKAVWTFQFAKGDASHVSLSSRPALSGNRKYFAVEDTAGVYLFETITGKPAGTIPFKVELSPYTASHCANEFSADGKTLLHKHGYGLGIVALDNAQHPVSVLPKPMGVKVIWTADWSGSNYVLLNHQYLYDIAKQVVVWQYDIPKGQVISDGDQTIVLHPSMRTHEDSIRVFTLPQTSDAAAIKEALGDKMSYVIKPGDKVSLDIKTKGDSKPLVDALTKKLQDNGLTVADGQPIQLVVSESTIRNMPTEYEAEPGVHISFPQKMTANVNATETKVAFVVDKTTVWEQSLIAGAPGLVQVKKGESLDTAVASQQGKIKETGLESLVLPKYVPALRDPPGYGRTDLGSVFPDGEQKHLAHHDRTPAKTRNE